MTTPVVAVPRGTGFKQLAALLAERRVSAVPVVDADGRVIGVVSVGDLLPKEAWRDAEPTRRQRLFDLPEMERAGAETAGELMTAPAVTVPPHATLSEAARLMARHRVKRLPVADRDGNLVGIVSRGDLLSVFLLPDTLLAGIIREELARHLPGLDIEDVHVTVEEGVVTLDGEVRSARLAAAAGRLAHSIEGVVSVRNRLRARHAQPLVPPTPGPLF
jgi:CBS domain-containing protein